jgi:predicted nuclease with TOPRIM domain
VQQQEAFENQLSDVSEKAKHQILEKNSILEELRVKHGNARDKVKRLEEEVTKLQDKTKSLKEVSKLQKENEELKISFDQLRSVNVAIMEQKTDNENEMDDLKKRLSEASETLRLHNERQTALDKALRYQLAKTHKVLKMTKTNMGDQENRAPLKENNHL